MLGVWVGTCYTDCKHAVKKVMTEVIHATFLMCDVVVNTHHVNSQWIRS